jgi:ubiquinone/menaquinone biosynthesis C-methylase UbiE
MNSDSIESASGSNYVMGRTSDEYERLRRQSKMLEPITLSVLDRIGLSAGMSCLDLGCGPGEVMRSMAERVGPIGQVVGIDVDEKLGTEMLSILDGRGYEACSFVTGKVESLEQIEKGYFDLVFARLLLLHLEDPLLALQKMYSRVKPGGRIVVQDFYFPTMDSYPTIEALVEFGTVFFGVYDKEGRETRMGLKLPAFFIEAGIGTPDGTDVAGFLHTAGINMIAAVYRSVLPLALKHGITTPERSDWFFEEIRKLEGTNQYVLSPSLVSAWKQKPAQAQ